MSYEMQSRTFAIVLAMLLCIASIGGGAMLLDIAATGGDPIAVRLA